jgi:hydroxymethylglutaryl-CoA lyase
VGTPKRTHEVFAAVTKVFPRERLSGHFHDTYGQAVANIYASLLEGIEIFHASVAGLGGCPYAKGATGNVATEDVLYLMNGLGIETGVDLSEVVRIGDSISAAIGKANASRAGRALIAKQKAAEEEATKSA